MRSEAKISPCNRYRYSLSRVWDEKLPRVAFVMLNPSTADDVKDDPTIRKCIGFAKRWGYGSIEVVNLFALRSRDPQALRTAEDAVGPENDWHIHDCVGRASRVVCAWGTKGSLFRRAGSVARYIPEAMALRLTKDGHPEHPLYVPYEIEPVPFAARTPGATEGDK